MKEKVEQAEEAVAGGEPTPEAQADGGQGIAPGMGMGMGGMGMGMGGGGGASLSWRNLRTFSSFKLPVFRLYYGAMLGQMAAMNMQMMTRSLLVFRLTDSAIALGIMALASSVPMLLFSIFGGVIADRVQKRLVILVGQAASALIALSIALTLSFGFLSADRPGSWLILVVAGVAQGTVMGLMMPSRQAMISEIVGEERLMNAVALNTFGMNIFRLMAPALAGVFIQLWGFASIYFIMTGMYLVAVFFISLMPSTGTVAIRGGRALADMKAGFQYVKKETILLLLLVITLVTVLLSMPYMLLLPVFTETILHVGAGGLGILMSVSGIGAIFGSIVLASLPNKRRGALMMWGVLVLAVALVGFSFSTSWTLSLVFIAFVGLGQTARMTLASSLLQYYTAVEYRGRVMSLYMMEFGLSSTSVFFAAVMADIFGVQWAVGGLAMVLVFLAIGVLIFSPRMRRLD